MSNEIMIQPTVDLPVVTPVDQSPAAVYLARLAPGSRRAMLQVLDVIARHLTGDVHTYQTLPWHQLRYQHTTAIRSALANQYAPSTANKALAALRGVLQEAWRLGQMSAEDYQRATDLTSIRGSSLPRGRALSHAELQTLFAVCRADSSPAGIRDAALLAILYGTGLRRSEVTALELGDYHPDDGRLTIRQGKGCKARLVYLPTPLRPTVVAWLQFRGISPGSLFCPLTKGGSISRRPLTDQAILVILRKRATEAGITFFSPHDLRRTFISDLLDAGVDIATVQKLAGHSNVQTTSRYDRRGEEAKQQAVDRLPVP